MLEIVQEGGTASEEVVTPAEVSEVISVEEVIAPDAETLLAGEEVTLPAEDVLPPPEVFEEPAAE